MRRFLRDNALSVTMFGCFLVLWAAAGALARRCR
jgi:hypothetical protein